MYWEKASPSHIDTWNAVIKARGTPSQGDWEGFEEWSEFDEAEVQVRLKLAADRFRQLPFSTNGRDVSGATACTRDIHDLIARWRARTRPNDNDGVGGPISCGLAADPIESESVCAH